MTFGDVLRIGAAAAISLGGGAALALAVLRWFGGVFAEQIAEAARHKHAAALEHLRAQYTTGLEELRSQIAEARARSGARMDNAVYRSKAQFDLEFRVLQEIWKQLSESRRRFGAIRAGFVVDEPGETGRQGRTRRGNALAVALNTLKPAAHDNQPFYPQEIFVTVQEFIGLCEHELIDLGYEPTDLPGWWERGHDNAKKSLELADVVAERMRMHLRNVVIID
jgi:hypothetical protein